jgi:hypothetical protein
MPCAPPCIPPTRAPRWPACWAVQASFGNIGGKGWEWVAAGYFIGGLYLLQQRIITWHMPAAFLATLLVISGGFATFDPTRFVGPSFHLFTGGAMLGAFFIVTDPVSGCTTPRGKLIFAAGIGAADLGHPHFRRLSGWHRVRRAADEHRGAADRHEHPAAGVRPQAEGRRQAMSDPLEIARRESSVLRISVRTAAIMLAFTVVFTALMAGTYKLTEPWSRPAPWPRNCA